MADQTPAQATPSKNLLTYNEYEILDEIQINGKIIKKFKHLSKGLGLDLDEHIIQLNKTSVLRTGKKEDIEREIKIINQLFKIVPDHTPKLLSDGIIQFSLYDKSINNVVK